MMRIDDYQYCNVNKLNKCHRKDDASLAAFQRFEHSAVMGIFPSPLSVTSSKVLGVLAR